MSGDIERTLAWCDIPCTLETMERKIIVESNEEMRAICVAFIQRLKTQQLTHLARRCLEADFVDDDTLTATYESRYVSEGARLAEGPYFGFVLLRRRETGWKISSMQFAAAADTTVNATLRDKDPTAERPGPVTTGADLPEA